MIQSSYKVEDFDRSFVDGLYALSKDGVSIHFTVDVDTDPCFGKEYALPRSRVTTLHVTTNTIEERDAFNLWLEKENFRLALKGLSMIRWESESYTP